MTRAAKSSVNFLGAGITRKSMRNFWVLMPMLVPFGSLGDPYGDMPGDPYGDIRGDMAGEASRGDWSGDMFSMSLTSCRSCIFATLQSGKKISCKLHTLLFIFPF